MHSLMKFFVLFTFVTTVIATCDPYPGVYEKASRLSPSDTVGVMRALTDLDTVKLQNLLDLNVSPMNNDDYRRIRCGVELALSAHLNQTSWFSRVANLLTFHNILTVVCICVFILFLLLFFSDLAFFIMRYAGDLFIRLFMNGFALKVLGIHVSFLLLCLKTSPSPWLDWMYTFDDYTPVLGFFIFQLTSRKIASDIDKESQDWTKFSIGHITICCIVGAIATIYHNQWFLGVITVLLIFVRAGFYTNSVTGGYVFGFDYRESLMQCMIIAFVMVSGFITARLKSPELYSEIQAFETGVMFWGTFVGLLSVLIYTDIDYSMSNLKLRGESAMLLNFCMGGLCLAAMYFGSILDISPLRTLGGTFMTFWGLDVQRNIFSRLGDRFSSTFIVLIILIDLITLRYYIKNYPDYFIVG